MEQALEKMIDKINPDYIFTQLMWSERVLVTGRKLGKKTVLFVRSVGSELVLDSSNYPHFIVANSPTTAKFVEDKWQVKPIIVLPIIYLDQYISEEIDSGEKFVTMFNPIKEKGGEIFYQIAKSLSDRSFLAIEGWHHWKNPKTGHWDLERLTSNSKAFGGDLRVPVEVDLSSLENVAYQKAVNDMRPLYSKTRLLLIPSVWEESYPRVALEAKVNGIPVIGSNTGSLAKAIGNGGLTIDEVTSIDAWVEAIEKFDDENYYRLVSKEAKRSVAQYNPRALIQDLLDALHQDIE